MKPSMVALAAAMAATLILTGVGKDWSELAAMAAASLASAIVLARGSKEGVLGAVATLAALLAAPAAIGLSQWMWLGSEDLAATEVRVAKWLAAGVWALMIGSLSDGSRRSLLDGLLGGGALVAAASTCYALAAPAGGGWPLANRNHLAAFCVLLLPLVASGERRGANSWRTGAAATLAICGLLAGSRAGFVLVLAELLLLLLLLAPRRSAKGLPRWTAYAGVALVAVALLFCLSPAGPLGHWPKAPWLLYRDQIWASGWELFLERPWSGHGLGSFRVVYPAHARFDTGEIVHRAHNDWLEWLVEGGAVGPLPMAVLGCWVVLHLRQRPWTLGVPLILIHSAVDYPLDRFLILLLLATVLAAAAGRGSTLSSKQQHLHARKKLRSAPITELESFAETALQ